MNSSWERLHRSYRHTSNLVAWFFEVFLKGQSWHWLGSFAALRVTSVDVFIIAFGVTICQYSCMMIQRGFWVDLIENAWKERPIVWLSGVRRAGKTSISKMINNIEYFDCELPRIRRLMDDVEGFLGELNNKRVILDEIHRLDNPSEVLKIAADHFPEIRVLATGSSTLGASAKFKDTLTGRKRDIWLTPMIRQDLIDFGNSDLKHRFLKGGLPPFFMAEDTPEGDFQEWMDSFWAKDIQELFRLERRASFQKFAELLMANSGCIFEATKFAGPCEVSRGTISNYLRALESTFVMHVVRPFSSHRPTEIVSAPKVYAFDTGFVCYHKGWRELRAEDIGSMWEHFILNEISAARQNREINYWRDKRGHEIDFVLASRDGNVTAIECKWSWNGFDHKNMASFRIQHSKGDNVVVANDVERPFVRQLGGVDVHFENAASLIGRLEKL